MGKNFSTGKETSKGKATTLARKAARTDKYSSPFRGLSTASKNNLK